METENKDWKPEVGGKACWVCLSTIKQGIVSELDVFRDKPHARLEPNFGWIRTKMLFPTPEAALASIRVYDLEGKSQEEMVGMLADKYATILANRKAWDKKAKDFTL